MTVSDVHQYFSLTAIQPPLDGAKEPARL